MSASTRGPMSSFPTLTVLLLCLCSLIYTSNASSDLHSDHNHHRIHPDLHEVDWGLNPVNVDPSTSVTTEHEQSWDGESAGYQAEFAIWGAGAERSIIGRAAAGVTALMNGQTSNSNISPGETVHFVLEQARIFNSTPRPLDSLVAGILGPNTNVTNAMFKRSLPDPDAEDVEKTDDYEEMDVDQSSTLLKRQQSTQSRMVYISVNTCLQPSVNGTGTSSSAPSQLTLYVSVDDSNQKPGPGQGTSANNIAISLVQGYASTIVQTTSNVYIGIGAPSASGAESGGWNFAVAASTDFPTYYYNGSTPLLWTLDTDSTGALLSTKSLTNPGLPPDVAQAWATNAPPMSLFVYNRSDTGLEGIRNSYCGLSQRLGSSTVNISSAIITPDGPTNEQRQRFHVTRLLPGQDYGAILAYKDQSVNQVWKSINFTTKRDGNCALVYDLPFCDSVAYAVPTNGTLNMTTLALTYDNNTQTYYQNFSNSLQQVACTIDNTSQYSLERTCDDCDRDYKAWLCAVTIPRCTDFSIGNMTTSGNGAIIVPRAAASNFTNGTTPDLAAFNYDPNIPNVLRYNSSRNPWIDTTIVPGPYSEILPCRNTCYEIVKSCPASLGFSCPAQERLFNRSYGIMPDRSSFVLGDLTCNYPDFDWSSFPSGGVRVEVGPWLFGIVGVIIWVNL